MDDDGTLMATDDEIADALRQVRGGIAGKQGNDGVYLAVGQVRLVLRSSEDWKEEWSDTNAMLSLSTHHGNVLDDELQAARAEIERLRSVESEALTVLRELVALYLSPHRPLVSVEDHAAELHAAFGRAAAVVERAEGAQ